MTEPKLLIRKKGEDGTKTFSIRIKQDIVNQIDELSEKTGRSRNELIGMLLEFGLAPRLRLIRRVES